MYCLRSMAICASTCTEVCYTRGIHCVNHSLSLAGASRLASRRGDRSQPLCGRTSSLCTASRGCPAGPARARCPGRLRPPPRPQRHGQATARRLRAFAVSAVGTTARLVTDAGRVAVRCDRCLDQVASEVVLRKRMMSTLSAVRGAVVSTARRVLLLRGCCCLLPGSD